jgi:ElaB/YqjD/DUF883 family membrane-anchored ribosome-binding protein
MKMKTKSDASTQTPKELLSDLQALVQEAEKLMGESISDHTSEAVDALRARFHAAQERLSEFYDDARAKVTAGAKCTDKAIRENPYQALAIAVGTGLLVGVLLGRRTH